MFVSTFSVIVSSTVASNYLRRLKLVCLFLHLACGVYEISLSSYTVETTLFDKYYRDMFVTLRIWLWSDIIFVTHYRDKQLFDNNYSDMFVFAFSIWFWSNITFMAHEYLPSIPVASHRSHKEYHYHCFNSVAPLSIQKYVHYNHAWYHNILFSIFDTLPGQRLV